MIEGYKKLLKYKKQNRLNNMFIFPNIEFRIDKVINVIDGNRSNPKRINLHVLFSPEVSIEDIEENFLHELDFVYEEDTFNAGEKRKLKIRNLRELGMKRKSEHSKFLTKSDLYIGCMTAVVDASQIKEKLEEKRSIFRGKYLIVLADEGLSLIHWDGQAHGIRKMLMQMSHCVFSSNPGTRDFCLGKTHSKEEKYIDEFKTLKPCVWGCDSHSLDERFLEPSASADGAINYCWIKSELTWDGLKQILYEPEERIRIQEINPEPQKSIYTIDKILISETKINSNLKINFTEIDFNPNLVAIIGGRGSGKTALLDIIASCYKEGDKLESIENSFYNRLYGKDNTNINLPINVNLKSVSKDEILTEFGKNRESFDKSDINYITQKHFEDFSSDYERLNDYVFKLIFSNFPDEKQYYDSAIHDIQSLINKLQKTNLSIYQLKNELKNKNTLERELNEKEGEKLDYINRIKDIEIKSKVSEDVKKISTDLFDAKSKKQKVESMLYRISAISNDINNFNELADLMDDFNHDLEADFPSVEAFPVEEIRKLFENINAVSSKNEIIFKNMSEEIDKLIALFKNKLQEFTDINKIISDLRQKENSTSSELSAMRLKLKELDKKEIDIKNLECVRDVCFIDIINKFLFLKNFILYILEDFELGKDKILDNLSFSAVLVINEAEYFININNKINHRSISEDSLRSILKENILDFLFEMISNSYDIEKIQYRDLTDNIIKTGNDLFAKKKNNIDYADFFNCLFQVPLKIKINISLNGIPLESLSMGQRAIVLLKIILAYDDKPLLIDQPEEDLDNRYIYEHLVEAFKEAKNKRQIFIATHNANLAVNTDAEQIIVAKYDEGTISYELGTLENPMTKKDIKQILEGGDAAFRKREEKYGTFF